MNTFILLICIMSSYAQQDIFKQYNFDDASSNLLVKLIENDGYEWTCINDNWYLKKGYTMINFIDNFVLDHINNINNNIINNNTVNNQDNPLLSFNNLASRLYIIQTNNIRQLDKSYSQGQTKLLPDFGGSRNQYLAMMYILEKLNLQDSDKTQNKESKHESN